MGSFLGASLQKKNDLHSKYPSTDKVSSARVGLPEHHLITVWNFFWLDLVHVLCNCPILFSKHRLAVVNYCLCLIQSFWTCFHSDPWLLEKWCNIDTFGLCTSQSNLILHMLTSGEFLLATIHGKVVALLIRTERCSYLASRSWPC